MKNLEYYEELERSIYWKDGQPYWKESRPNKKNKDCIAGNVSGTGYRRIRLTVNGKVRGVLAHRLLWFMTHGTLPVELDHINRIKDDNRIENLRECSRSENCINKPKKSGTTSKFIGVSWKEKNGKWQAQLKRNGKTKYLGLFNTQEEAYQARLEAEKKYLG